MNHLIGEKLSNCLTEILANTGDLVPCVNDEYVIVGLHSRRNFNGQMHPSFINSDGEDRGLYTEDAVESPEKIDVFFVWETEFILSGGRSFVNSWE